MVSVALIVCYCVKKPRTVAASCGKIELGQSPWEQNPIHDEKAHPLGKNPINRKNDNPELSIVGSLFYESSFSRSLSESQSSNHDGRPADHEYSGVYAADPNFSPNSVSGLKELS